jgi:transmembrane sensor
VKDEKNDIARDLVTRYLSGEASAEDEKQLLNWIAQKPENEQDYLATKKIFELSEQHYTAKGSELLDVDIDHEWNHFMSNIKKEAPVRTLEPEKQSSQLWYKIAAAILLLAVTGYLLNYFTTKTEEFTFDTADNTRTVSLPDGSQVILNKHSHIAYTTDFGKQDRKVKLTGEAFFQVNHDASKPFIIDVNNATIEVLGTSFNVRAYDQLKDVEVVVETGVVKLSASDHKTEVKLAAGQKGLYTRSNEAISSGINKDINFLSWNTQKIVFMENDLQSVVETLNKTYQVNIIIATNVPATCEVTVSFEHQTLESVLRVLERTLNLTYQIKGNQIEITGAGC